MTAPSLSYRRLAANAAAGAGGRLAAILLALGLTTVLVRTLGVADYGTWSFFFVLIGFHAQLDLGLAVAIERGVARAVADGRPERVARLIGSGIALAAGLSAGLQAVALALPDRWLAALGDVPTVRGCLRVLPACLFLSNAAALAGAGLAGLQQTTTLMLQRTVVGSVATAVVAALALAGVRRLDLLLLVYAAGLAAAAVASWRDVRRAVGGPTLPWPPDRESARHLLRVGGPLQTTTLVAQLGDHALRVLIGSRFGAAAMGTYDLASRAAAAPRSFVASLLVALVPFAAGRERRHGRAAFTESLWLATKYATLLIAVATAAGLVVATPLMLVWLGADAAVTDAAATLFAILLVALAVQTAAGPMAALGRADGRPGPEAAVTLIAQPLAVAAAATQPTLASAVAVFAAVVTGSVLLLWAWLYRRLDIAPPGAGWMLPLAATIAGIAVVGWAARTPVAVAPAWLALIGVPALVAAAAAALAVLSGAIPPAERRVLRGFVAGGRAADGAGAPR